MMILEQKKQMRIPGGFGSSHPVVGLFAYRDWTIKLSLCREDTGVASIPPLSGAIEVANEWLG